MKTDTTDSMIQEWLEKLRENSKVPLNAAYFGYSERQNHEEACTLFRFVFEKVLGWSPKEALHYLSYQIIEELNLKRPFNCLIYPKNAYKDRRYACFYVAILCYPKEFRTYNQQNLWVIEYQNCPKGRGYTIDFNEEDGYDKARYLLNFYLVNNSDPRFTDLERTYEFFATKEAEKFLKDIKLWNACKLFFRSPLEFFHASLPTDMGEKYSASMLTLQFTEFKKMSKLIPAFPKG